MNTLCPSEEIFGPLAPLICFNTIDDVIGTANDTQYRLAAYLFSEDNRINDRVNRQLEVGIVGVNTGIISTVVPPFGGIKASSIGREGGRIGLDDYLETKYVCYDMR